ncbi:MULTISPECIES: FUSC family protein [Tenacibaculum]|uniref:FUSC family protein n=1 Tax=Tenacibaculum TaxID=104267 RepID=UPI0021AF3CB1|nr:MULTISPECIES: FUSC family protein [Tenacibaculum]MCT4698962.1 FUSC family protein [Tenacibaculum haliotis]WBX70159.1 FUSC family protein [Tenacibaculum retecalamus]
MNKERRARIYLIIAFTIFFINLLNVDFDNLSWVINSKHYVNMLIAVLVFAIIFILNKKNNNS